MGGEFLGALASGAGDDFHELWVVRLALELLSGDSPITTIQVEGVRASESAGSSGAVWAGVDCSIYRRSDDGVETVEIQQLKYSPSAPKKPWTAARLTSGRGGDRSKTVLNKLARAYVNLRNKEGPRVTRIALVSNQPAAPKLLAAIADALRTELPKGWSTRKPSTDSCDAQRLFWASGLAQDAFKEFLALLAFDCGKHSRLSVDSEIIRTVRSWTDAESLETANKLKRFARFCMLPEGIRTPITRELVLLQFGTSDPKGLYPCESKAVEVLNPVPRAVAKDVAARLRLSQYLCLLGGAGTGKTTVLQQIRSDLPPGSVMVTFDCYGGGSYLDPSSYRHREEDAYRQIANEMAAALRLPLILASTSGRDHAARFRARIEATAEGVSAINAEALLVLAIDAADNSVTAAHAHAPPERSFVEDLVKFEQLPQNVRIIITARPGRVRDLALPSWFAAATIDGFTFAETAAFVTRRFNVADDWIEDFHRLTAGNPRFQSYVLAGIPPGSDLRDALVALRPGGRGLDDLFSEQFEEAIKKTGIKADIELVCAGLIALPRPIPLQALSQALDLSQDQVLEICMDLALTSGLRVSDDQVGFADEDFEHFVRNKASVRLAEVTPKVADFLLSTYETSGYAVENLASALYTANRRQELLKFVLSPPNSEALKRLDPVRRHEVETHRLQLAIRVCREADQPLDAVRYIVLGSEGVRTEAAIRQLIVEHPDLSVRFASPTVSRLVLMDGTQVPKHGALLAHAAEAYAQEGDFISARDAERRLSAWFRNREQALSEGDDYAHHEWDVTPEDLAPIVSAKVIEKGAEAGYLLLKRIRPGQFRLKVALSAVSRLIEFGHIEKLKDLAGVLPSRWRAITLVPLAIAGVEVDVKSLLPSLRHFASLEFEKSVGHYQREDLTGRLREIFVSGCEVLASTAAGRSDLRSLLAPFLDIELRRAKKFSAYDAATIDVLFRAYSICSAVDPKQFPQGALLVLSPEEEESQHRSPSERIDASHRIHEGMYACRAKYLVEPTEENWQALAAAAQRLAAEAWRLKSDYELTLLRRRLVCSLTVLLAVRASPDVLLWLITTVNPHWLLDKSEESLLAYSRISHFHEAQYQLINELIVAKRDCEDERIGSKEKASNLAHLARLLICISPADAKAVFFRSIDISEELDVEIHDLLMLAAGMVKHAAPSAADGRVASNLAEVVRDALIRFRHDSEAVPLAHTMTALAKLSFQHAVAAASRWHDEGIENFEAMISPVIGVALSNRRLSIGCAFALMGLLRRPEPSLVKALMCLASEGGPGVLGLVTEELARDVCLDRMEDSSALQCGEPAQGSWADRLVRLRQMQIFASAGDSEDKDTSSREKVSGCRTFSSKELTSAPELSSALAGELALRRANKEWVSLEDILSSVRSQVLPSQREAHLDALEGLDERFQDDDVVAGISAALQEWLVLSPAVEQWCRLRIPEIISRRFIGFFSYGRWAFPETLSQLRQAGGLTDLETSECILQGVENNAAQLSASGLLRVAGWIVDLSRPSDASTIMEWHLSRLANRIDASERESIEPTEQDAAPITGVASVLYRLMGDVDHRYRWKAAHAVRRLGRFAEASTLDALFDLATARSIPFYTSVGAPFYWLAARLWLMIALDRMAAESPSLIAKYADGLLLVATDPELPHVLIRGFAKDACMKLLDRGLWSPSSDTIDSLNSVNRSPLVPVEGNRYRGHGPSKSTRERFDFDTMDTTRYWYESVVDMFDELTMTDFLDKVEGFVIDKWCARSSRRWDERARKARFESSSWSLHSNSHGSIPVIEPYHTHLEWHGMWCALGALLAEQPLLRSPDDDYSYLAERIRRDQLTEAPFWLADLVTPRPLSPQFWSGPNQPDETWLRDVTGVDFLSFVLGEDDSLVVGGSSDTHSSKFSESVYVSSSIVSPRTGTSLLRALQSVEDSWDYYLPTEGHEEEIFEGEFQLRGWLRHRNTDGRADDTDEFNLGVGSISLEPGLAVIEALDIVKHKEAPIVWLRKSDGRITVRYEPWGRYSSKGGREEYLGSTVVSSGHYLKISLDGLTDFLAEQEMDLIVGVRVERRDERSKRTYNEEEDRKKEATFDRLFVFRRDGSIHTADGYLGAWRAHSS